MRAAMLTAAVLLLALALLASASPSTTTSHLHSRTGPRTPWYTRTAPPRGWQLTRPALPTDPVRFTLVLTGSAAGSAELERRFHAVSDPASSEYGAFMTNDEIEALVAPAPSDWRQLLSTLTAHGLQLGQLTQHGDSVDVACSVQQAEALFATHFYHYQHVQSGRTAIRQWGDYSLPAALGRLTELVLGVHTFPLHEQRAQMRNKREARTKQAMAAAAVSAAPTPAWVPQAVSALYGVPYPLAPLSHAEVNAGVIEWVDQTFSIPDLDKFARQVNTSVRDPTAYHIIGNNSISPYAGIEASLDIQWIEGINPASTPWFWIVDNDTDWMYTFTVQFLTAIDYPSIISLSYGLPEIEQCTAFGPHSDCNGLNYRQYIKNVDKQFMKIGLLGVSVIVCSQDRGTYMTEDGATAEVFLPEYPGTSPYVTSVGATEVGSPVFNLTRPPPACSSGQWSCVSSGVEQAVSVAISRYLSGGGFSTVDAQPAYQSAAVSGYLSSGVSLPDAMLWNRTGRGFPDVSAIGYNGYIVQNGDETLVSGTSMSTPIVAAVIALVAHDYYAITNTTLGFLNPLLYRAQAEGAGLFHDIPEGGDNCQTPKCSPTQDGFRTAKGWDPVTGLGSPVYPAMKKYITSLAHKVVARRRA